VEFSREQLLSAEAIKVDLDGNFIKVDDSDPYAANAYHQRKNKHKKKKYRAGFEKGPDKEGNYDSYHLILKPMKESDRDEESTKNSPDKDKADDDDDVEISDFENIKEYTRIDDKGRLVLQMRRFNLGETRRRTRILVNKVDAYVKKRRHKLVVKENAGLSFMGIFSMVFGLFILCLTVLLGQFMEEPPRRQGGPGARRKQQAGRNPAQTRSNLKYTSRKKY